MIGGKMSPSDSMPWEVSGWECIRNGTKVWITRRIDGDGYYDWTLDTISAEVQRVYNVVFPPITEGRARTLEEAKAAAEVAADAAVWVTQAEASA
jgi:hypothetical protein